MIGIFDRSHYEDVLVVRVHELVPDDVWGARYDEINAWEEALVAAGTTIVKCFLHVSHDKQKERLAERLADPTKHWKYNPGDVDERLLWPAYTEAYEAALERCSTQHAPWFVVPADRKWYRNWAVAQLLAEHLRALGLAWPVADFDVETEQAAGRGELKERTLREVEPARRGTEEGDDIPDFKEHFLMAERDTLIRSMHDLGAAAWFGGSLMGAVGVNGAADAAKDPTERLRLSSIGWAKWTPWQVAAVGVHAVGGIGLIISQPAPLRASSPAPPRTTSSRWS